MRSLAELSNAYRGTAYVLGDVVEADDAYTGEHCRGVVQLALEVGERLGLSPEQSRNLEFGALLHDVGKIAIPNEIINKPGKLDAHELQVVKTHTTEGQALLDRVGGFMSDVGRIVRSHHERWDGGGYPDGLAGEAIPLEARIVAACDSWNAMTTTRSYRKAMPFDARPRRSWSRARGASSTRAWSRRCSSSSPPPSYRQRCSGARPRMPAGSNTSSARRHAAAFWASGSGTFIALASSGGERRLDRGQRARPRRPHRCSSIRSSTSIRRRSPGSRR